jgi:hypothetical protein
MEQIAFGLFDWIDRGTAPMHQLYEDRLQLLQAADMAGFFCYHLAEHHLTPLSMAPSPALFLAAATQRTRRIRLGPLVYLLPLYDPLRLIAEVCMLDQMSRGRLELGIGRGISPYELRHYGVDPAASRMIFNETQQNRCQCMCSNSAGLLGPPSSTPACSSGSISSIGSGRSSSTSSRLISHCSIHERV